MKSYTIGYIWILLGIIGCGDDKIHTNPSFDSYADRFIADAEQYNTEITKDSINIQFMEHAEYSATGLVFGKCTNGIVYIVKDYWDSTSEEGRETLLYHELGHCVLHRGHESGSDEIGPKSVMVADSSLVTYYWAKNRDHYLKELFK